MPKGPQEMMQAVISNLPEKTGKSLDEWIALVTKDGPPGKKERIQWLKDVQKLGHVTAQIIVANIEGQGVVYDNPQKLVDELFGEPSQNLRQIYEKILESIQSLPGAKPKPCKTYIPLYHRRQFAMVKPVGSTHVELSLALGAEAPANGRLIPTKSRDAWMSHVVKLSASKDVNDEVREWLEKAYANAA
jgi:hypothetical protein